MKKKKVIIKNLLKIKDLNAYVLLDFHKILAKDIRLFRLFVIKFENRIIELEKDITIGKFRAKLYKRLNNYLDMNKQVFFNYWEVYKKLKIKELDLNKIPYAYLEYLRSRIYNSWRLIKLFNHYDSPYSVFMRGTKKFNIFDKQLTVILEILLIGFDLNKVKRKIKKIMDKLSLRISNYLRDKYK